MILPLFVLFSTLIARVGFPESKFNSCEAILVKENKIIVDMDDPDTARSFVIDFGRIESTFCNAIKSGEDSKIKSSLFSSAKFGHKSNSNLCETFGALGYDFFRKSREIFVIDFDASTICSVDDKTLSAQLGQNYVPIESEFRKNGVYIVIYIKRKSYKVKFDTGYEESVFINTANATPFLKEASRNYVTIDGNLAVYPNKWVTIGKNYYNSRIQVAEKGDSRIGMGFIKGFNWIIDFRKHKVYLKKNDISLDSQNVFPSEFATSPINGRLTFISKSEKANKFKLGNVVKTVNGIAVTDANVCEIQSLLRRTKNWDDLQIEVIDK